MNHRHDWPADGEDSGADHPRRCIAIGEHHCIRTASHGGDPDVTNADGSIAGGPAEHLAGFIVAHDVAGDVRCEGFVGVDPHLGDERSWTMTGSLEGGDLTLAPSVLCRSCGDHGFVREGKWVSA